MKWIWVALAWVSGALADAAIWLADRLANGRLAAKRRAIRTERSGQDPPPKKAAAIVLLALASALVWLVMKWWRYDPL